MSFSTSSEPRSASLLQSYMKKTWLGGNDGEKKLFLYTKQMSNMYLLFFLHFHCIRQSNPLQVLLVLLFDDLLFTGMRDLSQIIKKKQLKIV